MEKFRTALANPGFSLSVAMAFFRGFVFRWKVALFGPKNVTLGRGLRIYSKLHIHGPGRVFIGERFSCFRNTFKNVAIVTHHADAVVRIGDGNFFGGTEISCVRKVEIGDNNLFANATILDSDIIPHPNMQLDAAWMEKWAGGVSIGSRTWLAANTTVLKGVTLGDECVLSAGSVAAGSAEPCSLLLGIPARRIKSTREDS